MNFHLVKKKKSLHPLPKSLSSSSPPSNNQFFIFLSIIILICKDYYRTRSFGCFVCPPFGVVVCPFFLEWSVYFCYFYLLVCIIEDDLFGVSRNFKNSHFTTEDCSYYEGICISISSEHQITTEINCVKVNCDATDFEDGVVWISWEAIVISFS